MLKLKETIFSITNRCNLRCRMCDSPQEKTEELSTSQWKMAIKDIASIGSQTIVFSGGEPLLREDIFELISFTKSNHMNACLTSNGCLISDEVASKLSQSGINVVNISIEGDRKIHDYLRGDGIFDKAVSSLENLRKYRIESTIASTVLRYNYEYLTSVLKLAKQTGATTVRFQPFNRIFLKDASKEKDFFIDKRDIKKIQDIIENVISLANKYKISTDPVSYLRKIPFYLSGEIAFLQGGCSALWTSCSINSRGDILPCWVITSDDKLIGNIKQKGLYELWASERHERIREMIVQEGCPRCMMSCYDEVFGKDEGSRDLFKKVGKINKAEFYRKLINRLIQFIRGEIFKLKLRYRFYKSYNGSIGKVFKRIINNIRRKTEIRNFDKGQEINAAILEISLAKEKLNKEISKYI